MQGAADAYREVTAGGAAMCLRVAAAVPAMQVAVTEALDVSMQLKPSQLPASVRECARVHGASQ